MRETGALLQLLGVQCSRRSGKLRGDQIGEEPAILEQLIETAALDNAARIKHNYVISSPDS